jgi:hypothetical protein
VKGYKKHTHALNTIVKKGKKKKKKPKNEETQEMCVWKKNMLKINIPYNFLLEKKTTTLKHIGWL